MIKSFCCRETEKVFKRIKSKKLPGKMQRTAMRKLWVIDAATSINDLRIPPGNRLEKLSGRRKGQYGVRINRQWRICFNWRGGDAYQVEIVDYHS